jgi:hypothetical protein
MPKDHQGALSGVTYTIPELTDVRDIEVAFGGFADTLPPFPPTPPVMTVADLAASLTATVNHLYISQGAAAVTVTLPATGQPGDKISVAQVGAGIVTIVGIGAGVPATTGEHTAVTAVWDGAKWVGLPFSYSGTRPGESTGGTRPPVDLNGFRYHVFDAPGTYVFVPHKVLSVEAVVAAAGGGGETSSVGTAGPAGAGGQVLTAQTIQLNDWPTSTMVVVGAGGAQATDGGDSVLAGVTASGGVGGRAGQQTPASVPAVISGDWATVLGMTQLGGPGGSGPAAPTRRSIGGGGGYALLSPYPQETEEYSYTVGGTYDYDCSYGARAYQEQTGTTQHRGDTRPVYCPDGWRPSLVTDAMVQCQNIANPAQVANNGWMGGCPGGWYPCGMNCCTDVPTYETRYACDNGGNLSGTTCVKTCQGNNSQTVTGTRPKACNVGYTASGGMCVDSRATGGGPGGNGLVALRYQYP